MAIEITINGTVTLDESAGLQTGGVAVPPEDNNDSDVSLATLQTDAATFYARLNALSLDPDNALGYARSASDYITLSGEDSIVSLGFTTSSGAALPVYGGADPGAACNLTALDGGAITLFADSVLGNRVVYGVDTQGDVVFALFMDPNAGLTSAEVWMVEFEALDNPVDTDHDDPLTMTGLGVGAGVSTEFRFDDLPSGSNLFGIVGDENAGLLIFGRDIGLNSDNTYIANRTQEIKTSQAGLHDTIGIESQMFDPGDAAYFTFVNNPDPDVTGTALGSTEADDADNIAYGSTLEGDSAFIRIAQLQGNTAPSMSIQVFNIDDDNPQGVDMLDARGVNEAGKDPDIIAVRVYAADGTTLLESYSGGAEAGLSNTITISINSAGVATISGFSTNYKIEWDADEVFDQTLITGVAGKFDIGGFGINEATSVFEPLTGVRFEDDGPDVDLALSGTAELTVDETTLPASDSILASALFSTNTANFGTDGPGADDSVYELVLGDDNSGLFDTATGDEVLLSINADGTLITGSVDDGGAQTVFTIAINADTGEVTVTQSRAMVHGDATDPDEEDTPLTFAAGLVSVRRTITDGDDDSDSDTVDISSIFNFEDAGPTQPPAGEDVGNLITDDSLITDSANLSTDDVFPAAPNYGSDGPHAVNPLIFSLRLDDPVPGDGDDPDSGLVDTATGDSIRFVTVGDDIVGYVDSDGDGVIGAGETLEAVRYSLVAVDSDSYDVTFSQTRAVFHAVADTEETVAANTVFVERAAIDGDGDPAEVVDFDLGAVTFLLDDEPTIGPVANSIVDFAAGNSANQDLNGDVGNDPNASPYTITNFTATLTINGVDLEGVLSGDARTVTYYADTDESGVFGDGTDVAYYRLALGDQGGEGDYTFTVLVNPPPSFTEFRFDDLPSGSNLFGIVGDGGAGLVIFGRDIGLNSDNTYIANRTQEIKTSQAGLHDTIGIESQMFDPGDAAYFTFVSNPDANVTGTALGSTEADDADNIAYGSTLEGDSAFIRIAQLQGNTAPKMSIQLYNIDGSPQGVEMINERGVNAAGKDPDVTAVRVYAPDGVTLLESYAAGAEGGLSSSITIAIVDGVATIQGFGTNYVIEWDADEDFDQTLISGVAGKFDIGGFGFNQGNDTPDQLLEFTAQVLDGDGDTASAAWKVGIDGTGVHDDGIVTGVSII
jgi:hypothetical protein